ncbi:MAG TPA: sulfatase-like hydrolase/transferase, partial [Polyangiaceae bacterium]|nr:sulfatase-like hydrolase/transferase [Polyangiaceae bacterium]
LLVTGIDAAYAAEGTPTLHLFFAELGLVAPLAVVLGLSGALVAELLLPPGFPRLGRVLARVREESAARRRELAGRLVAGAVFAILALIVTTRVGLRVLAGADSPLASGAAMALVAVGAWGFVIFGAVGAGVLVEERWPNLAPDPVRVGLTAFGFFAAACALLVFLGTTSGAGGVLAVFGVFRRQELDLRAPALVLVIFLAAVCAPPVGRRTWSLALALAAFVPCIALLPAAASSFERHTGLSVERHAPLGKLLLAAARHATDRDHDGASAWFGGGDCAEGNPKISPSADDIPGNGIDEDCSGADATASVAPPPPAPLAQEDTAFVRDHLPKQPNVVLITIDATRAELGFLGYHTHPVSPHLDELAKKSTVFENAYSLASYTSKSLAPMLIGRYGSETHRGWLHFNRFTRDDIFVSERLKQAGIHTVSVQGHWYFFKNYGMERGYDRIDTQATPADQPIEGDRTSNGDVLSDRLIAELSRPELDTRQFFLWSHYIDPHAEYVPHTEFDFGHHGRELYDGELAFVDHHLGRVLEALAKRPFAERTVVIITSDHGEAFGEHGLYRHGFEVWEELVRVPLLIYVPGVTPRRIAVRRSAIDIVPTILDIFGLPSPAPDQKGAFHGVSLLPDVLAPPGYVPAPRIVYVDMPAGPYNDSREAYIENDLKLITSGNRALGLFDLKTDPGEKRDLLDDTSKARPLLTKAKAFRKTLDEVIERPH